MDQPAQMKMTEGKGPTTKDERRTLRYAQGKPVVVGRSSLVAIYRGDNTRLRRTNK